MNRNIRDTQGFGYAAQAKKFREAQELAESNTPGARRAAELVRTMYNAYKELNELTMPMQKADPQGAGVMRELNAVLYDLLQADWSDT